MVEEARVSTLIEIHDKIMLRLPPIQKLMYSQGDATMATDLAQSFYTMARRSNASHGTISRAAMELFSLVLSTFVEQSLLKYPDMSIDQLLQYLDRESEESIKMGRVTGVG